MNVMQLNTDIYNSLGVLSNDESYLEEALASYQSGLYGIEASSRRKNGFYSCGGFA